VNHIWEAVTAQQEISVIDMEVDNDLSHDELTEDQQTETF